MTKGMLHGMGSYTLSRGTRRGPPHVEPPPVRAGVDMPMMPFFHLIGELDRNILDGGDFPEEDYSMTYVGARFWLGHTGIAFSAALNANLDQIIQAGWGPNPVGGLIGITYTPWPPPPPPPVIVPPPAVEVVEEVPIAPPPAPAPAPQRDHRRDLLRRRQRAADQHRQGDPGRRGAAHEERPQLDGGRHRVLRQRRQ